MSEFRLDIDVGGIHTEFVLLNSAGGMLTEKVQSTPVNPEIAVIDGIVRLCGRDIESGHIDFFGHGTTVTTSG